MNQAEHPFSFTTASYLTQIGNQKATSLCQLGQGLKQCSDASIFHHTFQSLSRHHFLTEGFSNDFAQWVLAACNQPALAEKLASLDIRDYLSLTDLRHDLSHLVDEYCEQNPASAGQGSFEAFYFCESHEITVQTGMEARTLGEFRQVLERLSHASFNYHFISSRLRLQLRTNDFSIWFEHGLGLERLARRTNQIDIYTNTLESAREKLLLLIDKETNV